MPGLARRVFHAGAGLLTAHTARKLRQPCQAFAEQDRAWRSLVRAYAGTAYGEAAGLERSLTYAEFRHRILETQHPVRRRVVGAGWRLFGEVQH